VLSCTQPAAAGDEFTHGTVASQVGDAMLAAVSSVWRHTLLLAN
jgi:hypothetical protein